MSNYQPQSDVAAMMNLFEQKVGLFPAMIEDPKDRLLAANIVVEESLEFAKALGFIPAVDKNHNVTLVESGEEPNLVEAGDAIGDILVVTYGAANRLGIDATGETTTAPVFREVNRSNMTKRWPDGSIHRRELDGKVIKPDTYSPADIAGCLMSQKEEYVRKLAIASYPEIGTALAKGLEFFSFLTAQAFGKDMNLTYMSIEASQTNTYEGYFATARLSRHAAKYIVYSYGEPISLQKFTQFLDVQVDQAQVFLDLFAARFPKLIDLEAKPVDESISEPEEDLATPLSDKTDPDLSGVSEILPSLQSASGVITELLN